MHKATSKTIIELGGQVMERRLLEGLVENEDFLQEFSILNGLLLKGKDPDTIIDAIPSRFNINYEP